MSKNIKENTERCEEVDNAVETIRALKTIERLMKRKQYIKAVADEIKGGLAEGEHYYTLFGGNSNVGGGNRGWMGSMKARTMEDCENFIKNEILTAKGRADIFNEDGDGKDWAIIQMTVEDASEEDDDDAYYEETSYIEIERDDTKMPDTSIFGHKTFWDLTE